MFHYSQKVKFMLGFSVLLGLVAAGGLFTLLVDNDDENDIESEELESSSVDGDQSLDFSIDNATDGISATGEDGPLPQGEASQDSYDFAILDIDSVEWLEESTQVVLDGKIDEIKTEDGPLLVLDTEDPDTINVSGFSNAIVYSGDGDTVIGGDEGIFISVSEGGSLIEGGNSDDIYLSSGENDTVLAGGGDDFLISGNDASLLDGGDGNDTIYGSFEEFFLPTSTADFDELVDDASDTLVGGDGDDVIYAASGDSISSGSGDDVITIFGKGAVIDDFDPVNDASLIVLESDNFFDEGIYSVNAGSFQTVESGNLVKVYFEGDLVLSVNNSQGLQIEFKQAREDPPSTVTLYSNGEGTGPGIVITSSEST